MTVPRHWREAGGGQGGACRRHPFALTGAFDLAGFQVAHTGQGAGGDHRRQSGGENKAGRETAHIIDQHRAPGDIAADQAISLAKGAFDDIDLIGDAVAFGDAAAARPVHADGMNLVEIGQGAEAPGERADLGNRRDVALHRINTFKGDDFRRRRIGGGQQRGQMVKVVMAPDPLGAAGTAHALDHRGVILLVRKHHRAGTGGEQGGERRLVGDIARREQQRRRLAVQIGQFRLQRRVHTMAAGDIAGAAGAGATFAKRRHHGVAHHRRTAYGEIIVRGPDHHVARPIGGVGAKHRKAGRRFFQPGEHAVTVFHL